jgi:hypothetical protein
LCGELGCDVAGHERHGIFEGVYNHHTPEEGMRGEKKLFIKLKIDFSSIFSSLALSLTLHEENDFFDNFI